jgi:hypothetical protein
MAKNEGVSGWHAMRKEQLIKALVSANRRKSRAASRAKGVAQNGHSRSTNGQTANKPKARAARRIRKFQSARELLKLLSNSNGNGHHQEPEKDRLVVMVRGPYWLHASWELRRKSIERAAAAMGQMWHTAKPTLRLLAVTNNGTTNTSEQVVRDIEIHGGVSHWYVDVTDPPGSFQLEIGYLAENGAFNALSRSNVVSTPTPSDNTEMDENWQEVAQSCDQIYALSGGVDGNGSSADLKELFEERLRRPMGAPIVTRYGIAVEGFTENKNELEFEVDAELIVYGVASPRSHLTFHGKPIELREDGSFTIRTGLPEKRQIIPIVATRCDGVEQRTVVLAVERNTKVMEALFRDPDDHL